MRYVSTKSKSSQVRAHEAILQDLHPMGTLCARFLPTLGLDTIGSLCDATYEERATHILSLYFDEYTSEEIKSFTLAAYGEKASPRRHNKEPGSYPSSSCSEGW